MPDDLRDGPRDECGVFAIYAPGKEVSRLTYFALYALQHRGQESAGIAATDEGGYIITQRSLGLVSRAFKEHDLQALSGEIAVGHVRYSTTGKSDWESSQPVRRQGETKDGKLREIALAHNGNLTNAALLREQMLGRGITFSSTSDSEIIAALIAEKDDLKIEDAILKTMNEIEGAFSVAVMTHDKIVAFRDSAGIRPLVIGSLGGHYCCASETCALDIIGADYLRSVAPGEIVTFDKNGISSMNVLPSRRQAFCLFEYIYFSRPDSQVDGLVLQAARGKMGENLAIEHPAPQADLVISVPDSGNPAARGFARASGLPQDDGFVKNRYVARTFIEPGDDLRKQGLRMKFNPLPAIVAGKKLVVVDDSIVRGNTTRQIVSMLKKAGALEVHLRISSPPIVWPCYYGIDMSTTKEMIASGKTSEEIALLVGADSLAYLSLSGVYDAIGGDKSNHCDACFTGNYPLPNSFGASLPIA